MFAFPDNCKGKFYGNLRRNIISFFFKKNADVSSFVEIFG